ncbi:MAG TPA: four helix bundle protein [Thermoanaerobaculia bacterium]|nr:four helix bundle protein [Thermoanaerobaculia bacterium]
MKQFRDLEVWRRSHHLTLRIYRLSASFPGDERFGLMTQLRRSAVSVPSNIAEGAKRQRKQDYARFLNISEGSLAETSYLLLLARDLGYSSPQITEELLTESEEILRMLFSLRKKVEQRGDP